MALQGEVASGTVTVSWPSQSWVARRRRTLGSQVEAVLRNGRLVRIMGAVDPKLLANVLRVLASLAAR